jgi:hypothetical protein
MGNILNEIGLILDVLGFLLLLIYGFPSKIKTESDNANHLVSKKETEIEKSKRENDNCKIRIKAYIGTTLILLGFIFQFIGNLYQTNLYR